MTEDSAIPVADYDFFQQDKRDKVIEICEGGASRVAIIKGTSGAGKSEVSLQVFKTLELDNLVYGKFNSREEPTLRQSLMKFASRVNLNLNEPNNNDIGSVLKDICIQMKERFRGHRKLLIFDDVEVRHLLYEIDHQICKRIQDQREEWYIVVTTQHMSSERLTGCDHITERSVIELSGFSDRQFDQFFANLLTNYTLTERDKQRIKKTIGTLPIFLKVLRAELVKDQVLTSVGEALNSHLTTVNSSQTANKGVALIRLSFDRIIEDSNGRHELFKHMIRLLTTIGERRVTMDLLIELAEVVLSTDSSRRRTYQDAYKLMMDFVKAVADRSLANDELGKTKLFGVHYHVRHGMKTFREPFTASEDAELLWHALIALTRVISKDGRRLQSHDIYEYLCDHGSVLWGEIENFRRRTDMNKIRALSDATRLLTASLHAAMAYCKQALRLPLEETRKHIPTALDEMSMLLAGCPYDALEIMETDEPIDVSRARELFRLATDECPLSNNEFYNEFVDAVPSHHVVTKKDLEFMFERYQPGDNLSDWLANGFLDVKSGPLKLERYQELKASGKVVATEQLRKLYVVEMLAETYAIAAKERNYHGDDYPDDLRHKCISYGEAALAIYQNIRELPYLKIQLLAETIAERELLKVKMSDPVIDRDQLKKIEAGWEALKHPIGEDNAAYEYGMRRTNSARDGFHKNMCHEHKVVCQGKIFVKIWGNGEWDDARYTAICGEFDSLIKNTKRDMTIAKLRRSYAEFLWNCGKADTHQLRSRSRMEAEFCSRLLRDAIRVMLDAFINLHSFLQLETKDTKTFPELKRNCGRAVPFVRMLKKFFESYKENLSDGGLLPNEVMDCERRKYIRNFNEYYRQLSSLDKSAEFEIMNELYDEVDFPPSDNTAQMTGSTQATD